MNDVHLQGIEGKKVENVSHSFKNEKLLLVNGGNRLLLKVKVR